MLMGSGLEGTFGSEISAIYGDWKEKEVGGITTCVCPAPVFRKRVSPT